MKILKSELKMRTAATNSICLEQNPILVYMLCNDSVAIEQFRFHSNRCKDISVKYFINPEFPKEPPDFFIMPILKVHFLADPEFVPTPIICYGEDQYINRAFNMGYCDYLRESINFDELRHRILMHSRAMKLDILKFNTIIPRNDILSLKDHKVLQMMIKTHGFALNKETLEILLFNKQKPKESRAVDQYISRLRKKISILNSNTDCQLQIQTDYGNGYALIINSNC